MSYSSKILSWLRDPNNKVPATDAIAELEVFRKIISESFGLHFSNSDIDEAFRDFINTPREFRRFFQPDIIVKSQSKHDPAWRQLRANPKNEYWQRLRKFLAEERGRGLDSLADLDDESEAVVNLLGDPSLKDCERKGLVVGYVQSGKTANMAAVISKAADSGYKLVIVLAGILDSLRQQTQLRFDQELTGNPNSFVNNWASLPRVKTFRITDPTPNFQSVTQANPDDVRDGDMKKRQPDDLILRANTGTFLFVIKKNANRLGYLKDFILESCKQYLQGEEKYPFPVLIIDDEADQATINIQSKKGTVASTNAAIRDLLSVFKHRTYVGYTATPFANVLIDPEVTTDLFPEDFIVTLRKPRGYFGARELFGMSDRNDADEESPGLPVFRPISSFEVQTIKKISARKSLNEQLPALIKAVDSFILSSAVRIHRGHAGSDMSMLVHPSSYIRIMEDFADPLKAYVKRQQAEVAINRTDEILARLEELYITDFKPTSVKVSEAEKQEYDTPQFSAIRQACLDVITDLAIKVMHAKSGDYLQYFDSGKPKRYIVIGGNKLSRGLTIEGLSVSYFTRGSNAYDTLLQMGRWFGYRKSYVDLTRLFMTEVAKNDFMELAFVELDLRDQFAQYSYLKVTPREVPPRIYKVPSLQITAANKMGAAQKVRADFSGRLPQQNTYEFSQPRLIKDRNKKVLEILKSYGRYENISTILPEQVSRKSLILNRTISTNELCSTLLELDLTNVESTLFQQFLKDRMPDVNWMIYIANKTDMSLNVSIPLNDGTEHVALVNRSIKTASSNNLRIIVSESDIENLSMAIDRKSLAHEKTGYVIVYLINSDPKVLWGEDFANRAPAQYLTDKPDFICGLVFRVPNQVSAGEFYGIHRPVKPIFHEDDEFTVAPDEDE